MGIESDSRGLSSSAMYRSIRPHVCVCVFVLVLESSVAWLQVNDVHSFVHPMPHKYLHKANLQRNGVAAAVVVAAAVLS